MPRLARVVIPGTPHHVTQRGNRRQPTFFGEADYRLYVSLMAEWCERQGVEVWAYCLMPNHVHLIAVPASDEGLRLAVGEAHRRYTQYINRREKWLGHLWQGRFTSFPMDDPNALAAARYIELNPVRARLATHAWEYPWSSARAHLDGRDAPLVTVQPLLAMEPDWRSFLMTPWPSEEWETFRRHERTGRPMGTRSFVRALEAATGRALAPQKRGRKKKRDTIPISDARN